jgi:hypothetical protein
MVVELLLEKDVTMSMTKRDRASKVTASNPQMGWLEEIFCCSPPTAVALIGLVALMLVGMIHG